MHLLVGLGNPGERYRNTRHNTGSRFVDQLAAGLGLSFAPEPRLHAEVCDWRRAGGRVLLLKPMTFMNESGAAVAAASHYYRIAPAEIFVVFDDLDLPAGKVRLRHGGGHGGHNGLKSLNQHLGSADYVRIKIGIGRPDFGEVTPWVLGKPDISEQRLEARAFDCVKRHLDTILAGDLAHAANRIHLCLQEAASGDEDGWR